VTSPDWDDLESGGSGANDPQFASSSAPASKAGPDAQGSSILGDARTKDAAPPASAPITPAYAQQEKAANPESEWASEISDRVAKFRRRREGTPEPAEREFSLPFNHDTVSQKPAGSSFPSWRGGPEPKNLKLDVAFGERAALENSRKLDSVPLAGPYAPALAKREAEIIIAPRPKAQSQPAQLLESDFSETSSIPASDFAEVFSAPLGARFVAGVLDGLVLLASACLFAIVFWLVGGRLQLGSLNLGVLLFVAAFWIFTYFAAFTTLSLSTPGQALMGLSVRNFDGELPTRQECLLRAFGYLVSIASVMLGFLWAAMDSDRLAWHDHISCTLLSERDSG
jgi:uncharacterized RDD family membrane protein YckC